jgi:hypothetical protein
VIISVKRESSPLSLRIVEMKIVLALERQRKVVFPLALRFVTPRTIAGCYWYRNANCGKLWFCGHRKGDNTDERHDA